MPFPTPPAPKMTNISGTRGSGPSRESSFEGQRPRCRSSSELIGTPVAETTAGPGRAGAVPERASAQLFEQFAALLVPQALDSSRVADADLVHDAASLDLAEARKALEYGKHLHFANDLVGLTLVKKVLQRDRAHFEAVLELSALPASSSRLLEGCLALICGKSGRQRHGAHPSALQTGAVRSFVLKPGDG